MRNSSIILIGRDNKLKKCGDGIGFEAESLDLYLKGYELGSLRATSIRRVLFTLRQEYKSSK